MLTEGEVRFSGRVGVLNRAHEGLRASDPVSSRDGGFNPHPQWFIEVLPNKCIIFLGGVADFGKVSVCLSVLDFSDVVLFPQNVHQNYPGAEQKCIFLGPLRTHGARFSRRERGRRSCFLSPRASLSLPETSLCGAPRPGPPRARS